MKTRQIKKERSILMLGTLSPNPWDLTPLCHPMRGKKKTAGDAGFARPQHGLAPVSALRSHPCVALSSAPVRPSIAATNP